MTRKKKTPWPSLPLQVGAYKIESVENLGPKYKFSKYTNLERNNLSRMIQEMYQKNFATFM